jgi:hypothetical protein
MYSAAVIVVILAALLFTYLYIIRPWHLHWGATIVDRTAVLPGDALSPFASAVVTHAVNIDAPAEAVWHWIVQIGQERGGFYSYSFLENLIGCDMRNTFRIVPEWQQRAIGDTVWFGSPKRFGGRARMIAALVEPMHTLVLAAPTDWELIRGGKEGLDTTWTFALQRKGVNTTRLIARLRSAANVSLWDRIINFVFWEPAHFMMERKMLVTIKKLAEANPQATLSAASVAAQSNRSQSNG